MGQKSLKVLKTYMKATSEFQGQPGSIIDTQKLEMIRKMKGRQFVCITEIKSEITSIIAEKRTDRIYNKYYRFDQAFSNRLRRASSKNSKRISVIQEVLND